MDGEDPYVGQVIFNADGDKKGDTWDDSELIDYWDKAKEAYKRRQDQQNKKSAPFSTQKRYGHNKQRIEKRVPLKKKDTPSPPLPPQTPLSPPRTSTLPHLNDDDLFTQMIMAWYYAGYYTGVYLASSGDRIQ